MLIKGQLTFLRSLHHALDFMWVKTFEGLLGVREAMIPRQEVLRSGWFTSLKNLHP